MCYFGCNLMNIWRVGKKPPATSGIPVLPHSCICHCRDAVKSSLPDQNLSKQTLYSWVVMQHLKEALSLWIELCQYQHGFVSKVRFCYIQDKVGTWHTDDFLEWSGFEMPLACLENEKYSEFQFLSWKVLCSLVSEKSFSPANNPRSFTLSFKFT